MGPSHTSRRAMTDSLFKLHVEFPTEQPLQAPFEVRGWIVARGPIEAVGNGGEPTEWLQLRPRPDVRRDHPEWGHAVGFEGRLGTGALRDGALNLRVRVAGTDHLANAPVAPIEPPPDHLQVRQVGSVWGHRFYPAGRAMFDQVAALFSAAGQPLTDARRVLDFGCGCGRVLRSFAEVHARGEIWGCDIDGESIDWNQANLAAIARFCTNPTEPPTTFADGFFDAIYSVSVFTHLPEDRQMAWVRELHRILAPGGLLVPSFHGEAYWQRDPAVAAEVQARGFAYRTGEVTAGLPDFYMVAYHSTEYIAQHWAPWFEVVVHRPQWIDGAHDAVALRRKPG